MTTFNPQPSFTLSYSSLRTFSSLPTTHYFIYVMQWWKLFCSFTIRIILRSHSLNHPWNFLNSSLPYITQNSHIRRNLHVINVKTKNKLYTRRTSCFTLSNTEFWTEKYILSLLHYPLTGLTYNRSHYFIESKETQEPKFRLRHVRNQTTQIVLPAFLNRTSIFLPKVNLFLNWFKNCLGEQFWSYKQSSTYSVKHWLNTNSVHHLSPSYNLLFLDIKRPVVGPFKLNYLEIITFLSKYTYNQQTPLSSKIGAPINLSATFKRLSPYNSFYPMCIQLQKASHSRRILKKFLRYEHVISLLQLFKPVRWFSPVRWKPKLGQIHTFIRHYMGSTTYTLTKGKWIFPTKPPFWARFAQFTGASNTYIYSNLVFKRYHTKSYNGSMLNSKINTQPMCSPKVWHVTFNHKFEQRVQYITNSTNRVFSTVESRSNPHIRFTMESKRVLTKKQKPFSEMLPLKYLCLPTQLYKPYVRPSSVSLVLVYPRHTLRFRRSLFFFLLLLQEIKLISIDWLASVFKYSPFYSFTLFPSSNSFKVSIFKRLNMQKRLLTSQVYSYNETCRKSFRLQHATNRIFSTNNLSSKPLDAMKSSFSLTQLRLSFKYITYQTVTSSKYMRIRRLKFKPGYTRLWRESRTDIKEILEMKIRYQNRLTLRLQQLYRHKDCRSYTYSTATIFFALLGSQISVDMWSTLELFRNEVIYLNGKICTNQYTHLFLHDLIQVVINLKFYFLTRFLQNRIFLTITRFNKIFYRKYRTRPSNSMVRVQRKLPCTFFHLQSAYVDILPYLEVDYFTLSSFVILDQRAAKLWVPIRAHTLELNILNMYNWKYIT